MTSVRHWGDAIRRCKGGRWMMLFGENSPLVSDFGGADIEAKGRGMKIMLRDLETGLLYRQPGEWVESHMQATRFASPDEAEATARAVGKQKLEVFCILPDGR